MWKAFDEMEKLGWIGQKRPRMFSVQAEGCAPIVRAFETGENSAAEFPNAHTLAAEHIQKEESDRRFSFSKFFASRTAAPSQLTTQK